MHLAHCCWGHWSYAVSKGYFYLLCVFLLLLVCGYFGALFFHILHKLQSDSRWKFKGASIGVSFRTSLLQIIDNCLYFRSIKFGSSYREVLFPVGQAHSLNNLLNENIDVAGVIEDLSMFFQTCQFCFTSSYIVMQAHVHHCPCPFLFNWCPYCWNSLYPPQSCKNWIQTVPLTCLPGSSSILIILLQVGHHHQQTCSSILSSIYVLFAYISLHRSASSSVQDCSYFISSSLPFILISK